MADSLPHHVLTRFLPVALLFGPLLGAPAWAKTESFALDPVHTRLAFQVSHAGFSNPIGSFSRLSGSLEFDQDDWSTAHLSVRIPIDSLNLGDAPWQEKILDRTFFDAKKFPEARFVSTKVESTGTNSARVTGDLTLHGVTRPVTLTVTLNALRRHPLTLKKTAGFSATATLSRKDFGIDAWKSVVGDEVRLIIEAEAVRSHEPDAKDADDAAAK
jgi:polyisoprenoid-binding protein YceI